MQTDTNPDPDEFAISVWRGLSSVQLWELIDYPVSPGCNEREEDDLQVECDVMGQWSPGGLQSACLPACLLEDILSHLSGPASSIASCYV